MSKTHRYSPYLKYVFILAAAAVLLAAAVFGAAFAGRGSRPDIVYTNDSFRTAQEVDGELYIFDSWRLDENYGGTDRRIVSPVFSLRSGIYRITAAYSSGMAAEMLMEHGAHLSLVPEEEVENQPDPALYSESAMLTSKISAAGDAAPDTISILAYISYRGTNSKIKVSVDDGMPADVTLYNVSIRYLPLRTAAGRFITWLPAVWLVVSSSFS
ncbi:MAG: hypothetical protein J6P87_06420 [Lachnospiraceae bacterium]|nr:hypothetical protein [Lachnospiraceae bacterium]